MLSGFIQSLDTGSRGTRPAHARGREKEPRGSSSAITATTGNSHRRRARRPALELIFEEAADSPLAWQVDIAWLVRGGVDPKEWMKRYRDRVVSAHVKDIAPQGQNEDQDGWADVGAGVLDWRDLWSAARAAGAKWMVVEHDNPTDPAKTARASYAFISRMGG